MLNIETINSRSVLRYFVHSALFSLCLVAQAVNAFDQLSFEIENIVSKDWQLNHVNLSLLDIDQQPQLVLSIKQLTLPQPFKDITFFDVRCLSFSWQENEILCHEGKANIKSTRFYSMPFDFSFAITDKQSHFNIKNLKFSQGILALNAEMEDDTWSLKLKSKNIQLKHLKPLLVDKLLDDISSGSLDADMKASGKGGKVDQLVIKTQFKALTMQAKRGKVATESLNLVLDIVAKQKQGNWQWENNNHIQQGELYIDPVYMAIKGQGIRLKTKGVRYKKGLIELQKARFSESGVVELDAHGLINTQTDYAIDKANISADIKDLDVFTQQYVTPFMEQTGLEGIQLKGQLTTQINIANSLIAQAFVKLKKLDVGDDKNRLAIKQVKGELNWSSTEAASKPSYLHWDKLKVKVIPIDAGELKFLLLNKKITLLEKSSISLLGGMLEINQFDWQKKTTDEPDVYFSGAVNDLSLEQLSTALDWTPLSGHISGNIPGVDYKDKTLTVKGGLKVNVFDGEIKINKLSSSGMFSDFAKFHMDMVLKDIDLYALTQKFKMGAMEGRVSGFVKDLYLENWSPVTFYAWLGTPDNDDSRHRISQKAVQNIASIGGGATDVISKGFLRFFDTFSYDRLGFGCYLHQGVCQLMGVAAAEQGYYIVKGGGIPRIDVVGYNPQVDWAVLIQRLSRISMTDDVVIE